MVTLADGSHRVVRGLDPNKDQSYFLYRLSQDQMRRVIFPLGGLHKRDVRSMAARIGLPVAEKADSQEACFAAHGEHASVVLARQPRAGVPGTIIDESGNVLGTHGGLAHYTVGQRKGLGIGGLQEPLHVVAIDAESNRLVVASRGRLAVTCIQARDVVWHGAETEDIAAAVRYRMEPVRATATVREDSLTVILSEPVLGVATGQSVVCYRDGAVVGGGVISCVS
jgi:tRNA-specific 2-thiouridylase